MSTIPSGTKRSVSATSAKGFQFWPLVREPKDNVADSVSFMLIFKPRLWKDVNLFARWLVPEMVKNGFKSFFVFLRLIWTCLTGNLDRYERWQLMGSNKSGRK